MAGSIKKSMYGNAADIDEMKACTFLHESTYLCVTVTVRFRRHQADQWLSNASLAQGGAALAAELVHANPAGTVLPQCDKFAGLQCRGTCMLSL